MRSATRHHRSSRISARLVTSFACWPQRFAERVLTQSNRAQIRPAGARPDVAQRPLVEAGNVRDSSYALTTNRSSNAEGKLTCNLASNIRGGSIGPGGSEVGRSSALRLWHSTSQKSGRALVAYFHAPTRPSAPDCLNCANLSGVRRRDARRRTAGLRSPSRRLPWPRPCR